MKFEWTESLKFKISLIFSLGITIAFSINWNIAVKTIHLEKEQDVQLILHHLLVENQEAYFKNSSSISNNLDFLYQIPHNGLILSESEISNVKFSITKIPVQNNKNLIVSSIQLSNHLYFNAISDHSKIDQAVSNYGNKLFVRYLISLIVVLISIVWLLHYYMKPLDTLARKTREWKMEEPFDIFQEDAASEIKEVAKAFSGLVKRLEYYRIKEAQLFKEAAHELKTPLALMHSRLDVYEQSESYEKSKFVIDFSRDIERLTTELKTVLFFESSDFEEYESIDIYGAVQELKEKMSLLVSQKNLTITVSRETFEVFAPKRLLSKVLGALIENAITYAKEDSNVKITITKDEKTIYIINRIGADKYLFSSKIGNKILDRLSSEIGYVYAIEEQNENYTISLKFKGKEDTQTKKVG